MKHARSEAEMMKLVLDVASGDEHVRAVCMNGSRTNPNAPKDRFQDYDIVYIVTGMQSYLDNPGWIDVFGPRIILQTPEAMQLFPPELGNWFSYLMLFEDGNRIDLILVPLCELDKYLADDRLTVLLLDKDNRVPPLPPPTDEDYWVKKPTAAQLDDCYNEFWWLSTYVAKGLCRAELPYAVHHLAMMRNMLFTMLSWEAGLQTGFSVSTGKHFKYLQKFLPPKTWERVMATYQNGAPGDIRRAMWGCCGLFRQSSRTVAGALGFTCPNYGAKVGAYLRTICPPEK